MQTVKMPNGDELQFPDETTDHDIYVAIGENYRGLSEETDNAYALDQQMQAAQQEGAGISVTRAFMGMNPTPAPLPAVGQQPPGQGDIPGTPAQPLLDPAEFAPNQTAANVPLVIPQDTQPGLKVPGTGVLTSPASQVAGVDWPIEAPPTPLGPDPAAPLQSVAEVGKIPATNVVDDIQYENAVKAFQVELRARYEAAVLAGDKQRQEAMWANNTPEALAEQAGVQGGRIFGIGGGQGFRAIENAALANPFGRGLAKGAQYLGAIPKDLELDPQPGEVTVPLSAGYRLLEHGLSLAANDLPIMVIGGIAAKGVKGAIGLLGKSGAVGTALAPWLAPAIPKLAAEMVEGKITYEQASEELAKTMFTALATSGAGALAEPLGRIPKLGAEITAMTTAGAAAEGRTATAQEFAECALMIFALNGAGKMVGGKRPEAPTPEQAGLVEWVDMTPYNRVSGEGLGVFEPIGGMGGGDVTPGPVTPEMAAELQRQSIETLPPGERPLPPTAPPVVEPAPEATAGQPIPPDLASMKKPELIKYAKSVGIEGPYPIRNADLIKKIQTLAGATAPTAAEAPSPASGLGLNEPIPPAAPGKAQVSSPVPVPAAHTKPGAAGPENIPQGPDYAGTAGKKHTKLQLVSALLKHEKEMNAERMAAGLPPDVKIPASMSETNEKLIERLVNLDAERRGWGRFEPTKEGAAKRQTKPGVQGDIEAEPMRRTPIRDIPGQEVLPEGRETTVAGKRTVVGNSKQVLERVQEAFPGSKVSEHPSGNGFQIDLQNGKTIGVEISDNIPVDIPSVMKFYKVSRADAEQMAQGGVAGVTIPRGVRLTLADGRTLTPTEVMVLIDPARMNDGTARHEALHVAKELGLFDTKKGQKLWDSLVSRYGNEEGIAAAREEWTKPKGLFEQVQQFFMRVMSKLGRNVDPKFAMSETFSERFWQQVGSKGDRNELLYQFAKRGNEFPVTSIKNELVDELREERGADLIESAHGENMKAWLDAAGDTLAANSNAGEQLVNELAKDSRNLSPREGALLTMHHRKAYNDYVQISNEQFDAVDAGDSAMAAILYSNVIEQVTKMNQIEEVARNVGTLWSHEGTARKIMLRKDFSLEGLVRKARIAQAGENLSPDQMAELKAFSDQVKVLEGRLSEREVENADLKGQVAKLIEETVSQSRKPGIRPQKKAAVIQKRDAARAALKEAWTALGHTFVEKVDKPSGVKYNLGKPPRETSRETSDDTPELRAAAKQMADAYADLGTTRFGEFWGHVRRDLGADASRAEGVFRSAWNEIESRPDFVTPDLDVTRPDRVTREARAIQRRLAEAGINDLDQVVDIVQESLQDVLPTRQAAMEALTAYGQFTTPSKDEISSTIREWNAQLLQIAKINILEKGKVLAEQMSLEGMTDDQIVERLHSDDLMLKATGFLRNKPSDVVRRLTAQVNEAKKQIPVSTAAKEGQLQTAQDAAKRDVRNRIADLNWKIDNKERRVKTRSELRADPELTALRAERDALVKEYRKLFPPPGATEAQKDAAALKVLGRAISDIEGRLAVGNIDPKAPAPKRSNPAIDAERARLDAFRAQMDALREAKNPKLTPEERARKQYEANLKRRIADYEDILSEGDFSPKPKKAPRQLSLDELKIKRELEEVKNKVNEKMNEYCLAHLSLLGKAGDYSLETAHLTRSVLTAFDISAVARQGGIVSFGHPLLAKEAAESMMNAMFSKQAEFNTREAMHNHPLWNTSQQAKLNISEEGAGAARQEEAYQGRWAKKIPGIAASARAYSTYLNSLRFSLFVQMVENLGRKGQVTPAEAKVIANYINVATGRGNLFAFLKSGELMNAVFFAPRYVISRFQYLSMPFTTMASKKVSFRVKKAIAKEYARTFTGAATFIGTTMALGYLMANSEDEVPTMSFDPRSADFLKIKIGETRLDPTSGLSSTIVFGTRFALGQTKTASGEIKKLGEGYKPITRLSLAARFARTKLGPIPGAVATISNDFVDVVGNKQTPLSVVGGLFTPLSVRDVVETMKARGVRTGTALSVLTLMGMSINTYGARTLFEEGTPEDRKKMIEKDLKKQAKEVEEGGKATPLPYEDLITPEDREPIPRKSDKPSKFIGN